MAGGTNGNDVLSGTEQDDLLEGLGGDDSLSGHGGNDRLDGGLGADAMAGGTGNDTYLVDDAGDALVEAAGEGEDRVYASLSFVLAAGVSVERLFLTGTAAIDLTGNEIANIMTGNGGANRLDGGGGVDMMAGGAGDDTYIVDNAGESVIEDAGGGVDTIQSSVTFYLSDTYELENLTLTGAGSIDAYGNRYDNVLTGNAADNQLNGGTGADTMAGGAGNDTYFVDAAADRVVEAAGEGEDWLYSSVSYVLGAGVAVERLFLTGSAAIDLTGNELANIMTGNGGANRLDGGGGVDMMAGGAGDDTYVVDNAGESVIEDAGGGVDTIQSSVTFYLSDTYELENLTLTGTGSIDAYGNRYDNRLTGNGADNHLNGGAGADTMAGGAGNDSYIVDNAGDAIVEAAGEGEDRLYASVSYALGAGIALERLFLTGSAAIDLAGNELANILTGNGGANRLDGGGGVDMMAGGGGNDTYVVDHGAETVIEDMGGGVDTILSSATFYLSDTYELENVTLTGAREISAYGNRFDNLLIGNAAANRLAGGAGDDTLDGGAGTDAMAGGTGNDTYHVDNAADAISEAAGEGEDRLYSSVSYVLAEGVSVERLYLTGTATANLTGNGFANVITGNGADNRLDGGGGVDLMAGGGGNDTYVVDEAWETVIESAGGGIDTVLSAATFYLSDTYEVENVTLTGSAAASAYGNGLDNVLTGNGASNVLAGGGGNDRLDGGLGADSMAGGAGDDIYQVDHAGDLISEAPGEGEDRLYAGVSYVLGAGAAVERLYLSGSAAIDLAGNEFANVLTGNAAANRLDGGAGADIMAGGAGDDTYVVDQAGDSAIESAGAGNDTVLSAVTFYLSDSYEIENLSLTGTAAVDAYGNRLANVLTGNGSDNVLNGGAGADLMIGGDGNDTYHVDSAGDRAVETSAGGGIDTVVSAVSFSLAGEQTENLSLTGSAVEAIGNALANSLTGTAGANLLDGGAGSDRLQGGGGADTFRFADALGAGNVDAVVDFVVGADRILLGGLAGQPFAALRGGALADGAFRIGSTAVDADDRILYDGGTGALYYDADGAGGAAAVQFATLSAGLSLTAAQFEVSGGTGNNAPTIGSAATASVAENSATATIVYQTLASDPDGDTLTYSLSGSDAGAFTIDSSGAVRFVNSPDYETRSSYDIIVHAADPSGAIASRAVVVSVTDVNDTAPANSAPTIGSAATASVAENSATTTIVYQTLASDADGDTLTYSLSGSDAAAFTIDGSGAVRFVNSPDYETRSSYDITVHAADPKGAVASRAVVVSVTDVDESAPVKPPYNVTETTGENGSRGSAQALDRTLFAPVDDANVPNPTLPTARIDGTVAAGGDLDFFSVTLQAGELLVLDVDATTSLDSWLTVYGPDGIEVAFNDDKVSFDAGSTAHSGVSHNLDSYVSVRAPTAGTYTFSIRSYVDDTGLPSSSGAYRINVNIGPVATKAQIDEENIQALISGAAWESTSVSYAFTSDASHYGPGEGTDEIAAGMSALSSTQQGAVVRMLGQISAVTNLDFANMASNPGGAQMRYALSNEPETAHAYYPTTGNGGDSWYNTTKYTNPVVGNYQWLTFLHETAHALGLKHGHESPALSPDRDSMEYSIMTYRSYIGAPTGADGGFTNETYGFAQTLMMYDIAALQRMYGADFTTNAGDSVYSWSPTSGAFLIDGGTQWTPGGNRVFMTIWDGGGNDTYNLSNFTNNVTIDLRPGEWTTTSQVQLANLGNGHYARGNVANALLHNGDTRSLIENAVGGGGNDILIGNQAANRLTGGSGADSFRLMSASDSAPGAADTIADFLRGTDRIDLSLLDGDSGAEGRQGFTFLGTAAFSPDGDGLGEVRYEVVNGAVHIFGDVNNDGAADFQLILSNLSSLTASDFTF